MRMLEHALIGNSAIGKLGPIPCNKLPGKPDYRQSSFAALMRSAWNEPDTFASWLSGKKSRHVPGARVLAKCGMRGNMFQ